MAPATFVQKIRRAARNQQRARGIWSTPFPHDIEKQQQASALKKRTNSTKVTKITSKPYNTFKKNEELLADFLESTTTKALEKPTQTVCKDEESDIVSTLVTTTTTESVSKSKVRHDSLSPNITTPSAEPGFKRSSTGLSFESSSSAATTSVRGVHLLLAIIPAVYYDRWISDCNHLCSLYGNNIDAYYSSIETASDPAGIKIYADCDSKTLGNMLKKKVDGDRVLNKKLICRFI